MQRHTDDGVGRFSGVDRRERRRPSRNETASSGSPTRTASPTARRRNAPPAGARPGRRAAPSHAVWEPPSAGPTRSDPEAQAASRVAELVPIRHGRMLASPFAYYRGAAAIMAVRPRGDATDRASGPGCGDAHLSNFGLFASPERALMFDVNDFDETLPGPWEWDVKRLAASVAIAGRANGFSDAERERRAAARRRQLSARDGDVRRDARTSRSGTRASTIEDGLPLRPQEPRQARTPRWRGDRRQGEHARTACRRSRKPHEDGRRRAAHRQRPAA